MSQAASLSVGHESATGVASHKLGMWLFLASEVMFFAGLFAAYLVLRMSNPAWPGSEGHLSVPIGTFNTLILICSSMTMVMAYAKVQEGRQQQAATYLLVTILLGCAFLGIKGFEYSAKFHHEIFPSTNVFWSCYFTLTGLHGLHVLGGVITNLWVWSLAVRGRLSLAKAYVPELAGLYWHFVDIVWIFLFPLLYLI